MDGDRGRGGRSGIPDLLSVEGPTPRAEMTDDRKIVSAGARGLPFLSFGFFLGEKSPTVWRGPLVAEAVEMFDALEVPVAGVIENMSHAACECGRRFHPFGHGGGERLAEETVRPLLARIPVVPEEERSGPKREVAAPRDALPGEAGDAFRGAAQDLADPLTARPAGPDGRGAP